MGSMKQLRYLDLSSASFGPIPASFGKLSALTTLDLSNNKLSGEIPASLGNLFNLTVLYLFGNNLNSIASSLRFPSNLESLSLSNNNLSGQIKTSIRNLSKLQSLDISVNLLEGTVLSEPDFANLSNLTDLDMSRTMLTLNLSSDWIPPFQLQSLHADTCKINGQLPPWLQTQKSLYNLILSNANISGIIPRWIHTMQQLEFVDLSNNKLSGSLIFPINFVTIDFSNNFLSGEFLSNASKAEVYSRANVISLSSNFIAGPFPEGLNHIMPNLGTLIIDNNQISGPIPNSFCNMSLLTLDVERNRLSGVIPNCWSNISSMTFLNLSHNKLRGPIPCFYEIYDSLIYSYLHLNDNMFSGEIPSCFNNLTNLQALDLGGNQLSGKMNNWFSAEKLQILKILRLRGNKLSGTIPKQICSLPQLQLMDLGNNHFTGSIPRCLSNLTAMSSPSALQLPDVDDVSEVVQGIERAYRSTLRYLVDIDLSSNNLVGRIPDDITKISGLLSLNLSYNHLSGAIPENIGGLKSLVSLDLSNNKLMGSIPTSIGEIPMLSHLNLSYNNLSGQIPTGNQLQTLSNQASIYVGNPYLCGTFLPNKCKSKVDKQEKGTSNEANGNNKEKLKKMGFELVVMSGFATGFWGVVGCLVLNRRWRHAYFRHLEDGYNWLYVIVVLKVRMLKAKIKRGE